MKWDSGAPLRGNIWVGLDPSYSGFGVAAIDDAGQYKIAVGAAAGTGGQRLARIEEWLRMQFADLPPVTRLSMEGPAYGAPMGHISGELHGVVKLFLWKLQLEPVLVSPPTLKKFVLGIGRGQKQQMMLQAYKKWGIDFGGNDNAVDAYALARIARGRPDFAYEAEVLKKLGLKETAKLS